MTVSTLSALQAEILSNIPSSNPAALTAAALRGVLADMAAYLGLCSSVPVTVTGTSYTVGVTDFGIIANPSFSLTLTLPPAASFPGRILNIKNISIFAVTSASANVAPLAGGSAGTAILTTTAGKWASLQSDGANWIIMAAN